MVILVLMKTTDPPIIVEEIYNRPVAEVWSAITELSQMRQWFFENIPAFEPRVGFEVSFDVVAPSRVFPHVWKIVEAIPDQKITYDWNSGDAFEGAGLVTFELFPEGNQTKIRLTNKITRDYPTGIPEFTTESCRGGWNYFIKERLKAYIEI